MGHSFPFPFLAGMFAALGSQSLFSVPPHLTFLHQIIVVFLAQPALLLTHLFLGFVLVLHDTQATFKLNEFGLKGNLLVADLADFLIAGAQHLHQLIVVR